MEPKVTESVPLKYDSNTQVSFRNPSVATVQGNAGGLTVIGGTGSGDDITLKSTTHGTKGTLFLDDTVNLWTSFPDNPGAINVMTFDATFTDSTGSGMSGYGFLFNPTYTNSGSSLLLAQFGAVKGGGTYSFGMNPFYTNLFQLFVAQPAMTATAAGVAISAWTILSQQSIKTGSTIAASAASNFYGFQENSSFASTGSGGSIGFTQVCGFQFAPRMDAGTGATTTITTLRGLWVKDVAKTGLGTNTVTTQVGVDIEDLTGGGTDIAIRSQGTAPMYFGGSATFGANSAPDTTIHMKGSTAAMTMEESSATPSNPSSGSQCRVYMKTDKLVIQYNDGGTIRYKYLDLTGTGVTWTHTTTAP